MVIGARGIGPSVLVFAFSLSCSGEPGIWDTGPDTLVPDAGQPDLATDAPGPDGAPPDVAVTEDLHVDLEDDLLIPDTLTPDAPPCIGSSECDDGLPCTTDLCTVGGCVNILDGNHCLIAGTCVPVGAADPNDPLGCKRCDPTADDKAWTQLTCVSTIAGSGIGGGFADGPVQTARFNQPQGIGVDASGKVYVADSYNRRVRVIDGTTVSTHAGSGLACRDGSTSVAQLCDPYGLAMDAASKVYISDAHVIRVISGGQVSSLAGQLGKKGFADGPAAAALFDTPRGIAIDSSGKIYVADSKNHRIRIVDGGQVTTLAGSGTAGFADGPAQTAQFNEPVDVAMDAAGKVYVADYNNNRIRVIDGGVVTTMAGSTAGFVDGEAAKAKFFRPAAVAVDGSGQVFVADALNRRIRLIVSSQVTTYAGTGQATWLDGPKETAAFSFPRTLALDAVGDLLVGDQCTVRKISAGQVTTITGKGTSCSMTWNQKDIDGPVDAVWVGYVKSIIDSGSGTILFVDESHKRVRKIASGQVSTLAGHSLTGFSDGPAAEAQFVRPIGLAAEPTGRVVLTDSAYLTYYEASNRVRSVELNGQVTTIAGGQYSTTFWEPRGVAVAANGDLYVADTKRHRIRKVSGGNVTNVAGSTTAGYVDGPASSARFDQPYDVAIDGSGKIYVADLNNSKIRVIDGGQVSTLAGGMAGFLDGPVSLAMFNKPEGVAVDSSGKVYVADTENHRVRVIDKGQVTTLAGCGFAGLLDGPASSAAFNRPTRLTVDPSGVVYVSDLENHRIRKITP